MTRYLRIVIIALGTMAFTMSMFSCGTDLSNENEVSEPEASALTDVKKIEKQVLDIHDEVMPKMAELNNTTKKLINKLATPDTAGYSEEIRTTIDRLEEADSLMWDWMHNYSRPEYTANLDSARIYLNSELEKVTIMRDKFNRSLRDGTELLEKLNIENE